MHRRITSALLAVLVTAALCSAACCAVVYVKSDSVGPAFDGNSWDTAFHNVQEGVNAASSGDEVWVAKGTYVENITTKSGVALLGGFAGTETASDQRDRQANESILDGNYAGTTVTVPMYASSATVVDGFTIRRGLASRLPVYEGSFWISSYQGGGIQCDSDSAPVISNNTVTLSRGHGIHCAKKTHPTISNNTVCKNSTTGICADLASCPVIRDNNITENAGGIACFCMSKPTITGNVIAENQGTQLWGGGICCFESQPLISGNTISGNGASLGGGIYIYYRYYATGGSICDNTIIANHAVNGGGIYCEYAQPVIERNIVSGNSAAAQGGGVFCARSPAALRNNTVRENTAGYEGGGIYCYSGSSSIVSNAITGNSGSAGGGIYCYNSTPGIAYNTIAYNTAPKGCGVGCNAESSPTITCNVIASSGHAFYKERGTGVLLLRRNCVFSPDGILYGPLHGPEDLYADPLFVNPQAGDYRLRWDSPCVDSGISEGAPASDALGNARPIDGNWDGVSVVDLGAFEYKPPQVTMDIVPGDAANSINTNKNGMVTVAIIGTADLDAQAVNAASIRLGPSKAVEVHGRGHLEDVNGDGRVDMLLHFRCQDVGLTPGTSTLTMTGCLLSGESFVCSDSVNVGSVTARSR